MFKWGCVLFAIIIAHTNCDDFDDFYKYCDKVLKHTDEYKLPKNNEGALKTQTKEIFDYGSFDFVIVGGGAAGTLLAHRLSEIKDWNILLLEAGGPSNKFTDIPAMNQYSEKSEMNWGYYTVPQTTCCQGMENKQCMYPNGKVLGGSGILNAMIYARGNAGNFDDWAKLGNPGWSYEDVLPYFKKSEHVDFEDYDQGYHGTDGLLHVNYTGPQSVLSKTYLAGMKELGQKELDYNGKSQLGVSKLQNTINFNKRQDGGTVWIKPIEATRSNLKVTLNAFVVKIKVEGDTATGVEFILNEKRYTVTAKKEVLVSAGSVNSAQLLMLSGIGPKEDLEKLNIEVKNNLPVGKKLLDHPMYVSLYFRTNASDEAVDLKTMLHRYLDGKTPLTRAYGCEQVAFINFKTPNEGQPDVELITIPQPTSVPSNPKFFYNLNDDFNNALKNVNPLTDFSTLVVVLRPKSRGSMTLKSNNPVDFPLVDVNFFSDPNNEDIETMYQGIQYIFRLAQTSAFKAINATYVDTVPGCKNHELLSKDYWYCAIRHISSTIYHPTATCTMGPDPATAVVDHNLLVHKMKQLRVVGEPVMPLLVTGHPYAASYMIAEKTADAIKRLHGQPTSP